MVTINRYIKALLHPAGGHQGSHKAHQAGNQKVVRDLFYTKLSLIQITACRLVGNRPLFQQMLEYC